MADSRDITGKNRKFTGTDSIKLPSGTTAQRVGAAGGEIRFNNESNLAEYYTGTEWKAIDAPPTITAFTVDGGADVTSAFIDASAGGNATIQVKGSLFDTTGANVTFVGTSETLSTASITRNSANLLTVTIARSGFDNSNEPYTIKVTNGSGLSAELADAISQDSAPAFSTAADTTVLSTYESQSAPFSETTLAATDADGDTVTHTISAGSLPPGLSLSTAGALTGTVSGSSIQNYTFTVQAATSNQTVTRQFVIAITGNPYISATGGTITTSGDYKIHTFTGDGCFVVSNAGTPAGADTVDYLVVAGGGGAGVSGTSDPSGGGGAGGYRESSGAASGCYTVSPRGSGVSALSISASTYPITVGGGGSGSSSFPSKGGNGGNSNFSTITSTGGGGGGSGYGYGGTEGSRDGNPGGSGGGAGYSGPAGGGGSAGSGNSPPVSPPQGSPGNPTPGSDGGSALSTGSGNGATSSINASPVKRANGADGGNPGGPAGAANTGNGGGALFNGNGRSGGSGIVIIRYKFQ